MRLRLNFAHQAILALAAASAVNAPIADGILRAQSAETGGFDVASVKRHVSGSGYEPLSCSNGRFVSIGFPITGIIMWAYDLTQGQMIEMQARLPKWMFPEGGTVATLAYDIQAKSERRLTESQCKAMMQALLADRFKLAVHWESKEGEVTDLVVDRGGPKMQKWSDTEAGGGFTVILNGKQMTSGGSTVPAGQTMRELAEFLTGMGGIGVRGASRNQPVIDKTGLEGRYKIVLKFSGQRPGGNPAFEDPDLETALRQQLGLKLETHKGIVKTLVVDHIEQPSAN